jgi:K+-transporting ATPase KdpF subunit
VALGRHGLLCRFLRPDLFLRQLARGGLNVDWTMIVALIMTAGLAVYLAAALLKPENFS